MAGKAVLGRIVSQRIFCFASPHWSGSVTGLSVPSKLGHVAFMRIVADENIAEVAAFFADFGEVHCLPGRAISTADLQQADILLVRSVTRVNESLLAGTPIKFVGTCTIGTDHLDQDYLRRCGIGVASAPGCNAQAVVDYVIGAMSDIASRDGLCLPDRVLGIVGLGNVGSRLRQRAQALGMRCICCDPPLAAGGVKGLVGLPELLAQADIVSLHTPLILGGNDPTYHLLNRDNLERLQPGTIVINSSRGAVLDNQALKAVLMQRPDLRVVLDVWENEPEIDLELLSRVSIGTPHIAGYSLEGKLRGTAMVYEAACRFFGQRVRHRIDDYLPAPQMLAPQSELQTGIESLYQLVRECYDIAADAEPLRSLAGQGRDGLAAGFDRLRKDYPLRREFAYLRLSGCAEQPLLQQQLQALGIGLC